MTIRQTELRGNPRWLVTHQEGKKCVRRYFRRESDAKRYASGVRRKERKVIPALMGMGESEQMRMVVAYEGAKEMGVTLLDLLEYYRENKGRVVSGVRMGEAFKEFVAEKRAKNLRAVSLSSYGRVAAFLVGREHRGFDSVSKGEVLGYLGGHGWSVWSVLTVRKLLRGFWSWAVLNGYASHNVIDLVPSPSADAPPKRPLGLREVVKLLRCAREDVELLATVCLVLFAGLRRGEASKIKWGDVDLTGNRVVCVGADIAKLRRVRFVDLEANAVEWLKLAKGLGSALPLNMARFNYLHAIKLKELGLQRNCMRDSFVSYHVAAFENVSRTAMQAGNSEAMIFKHYRKLLTKKEGEAFWRIFPSCCLVK